MTQTDTPELVRRDQPLDLAETPIGQFQPLDLHTEGWTKPVERLEALATISAGYKTTSQKGFEIPARTRPEDERQIHLHDPLGRAPGLAAALEATGYRSLMIAFGHDDPRLFLQQSFRIYTTSALVAYGDASGMTEIFTREETQQRTDRKTGEIRNVTAAVADHVTYGPKTERFAAIAKAAKVYSSLYFYLASWTPEGPRVIFPDGVGCYRLRTTSRNSVEAIVAQLKELARYSQGQLAGIPFELSLTHREAADPFGKKQTIPVWSIVPKGPPGEMLTSQTFSLAVGKGLEQGRQLMLPAPPRETIADAASDVLEGEFREEPEAAPADLLEPTAEELELIAAGGPCDRTYWSSAWFAVAKHSPLEDAEARAEFIFDYTDGEYSSLAAFLRASTAERAHGLIEAAKVAVRFGETPPEPTPAPRYDDIYGSDDDDEPPVHVAEESPPAPESDPEPPTGPAQDADEAYSAAPSQPTPEQNRAWTLLSTAVAQAMTVEALNEAEHDLGPASLRGELTTDQYFDLMDKVAERRRWLEAAK
jgi:hypothetical protein